MLSLCTILIAIMPINIMYPTTKKDLKVELLEAKDIHVRLPCGALAHSFVITVVHGTTGRKISIESI